MECFVQMQSTSLNWLVSDAVNLQPCYWQTLEKQCKLFVSYSLLIIQDMAGKNKHSKASLHWRCFQWEIQLWHRQAQLLLTSVSAALDYPRDEFHPQSLSSNECSGTSIKHYKQRISSSSIIHAVNRHGEQAGDRRKILCVLYWFANIQWLNQQQHTDKVRILSAPL